MKNTKSKRKPNQLSKGASRMKRNDKFADGNLSFTFDFHALHLKWVGLHCFAMHAYKSQCKCIFSRECVRCQYFYTFDKMKFKDECNAVFDFRDIEMSITKVLQFSLFVRISMVLISCVKDGHRWEVTVDGILMF